MFKGVLTKMKQDVITVSIQLEIHNEAFRKASSEPEPK